MRNPEATEAVALIGKVGYPGADSRWNVVENDLEGVVPETVDIDTRPPRVDDSPRGIDREHYQVGLHEIFVKVALFLVEVAVAKQLTPNDGLRRARRPCHIGNPLVFGGISVVARATGNQTGGHDDE